MHTTACLWYTIDVELQLVTTPIRTQIHNKYWKSNQWKPVNEQITNIVISQCTQWSFPSANTEMLTGKLIKIYLSCYD